MNRNRVSLLLLSLAAALGCRPGTPAASRRPNVLVVTIDTIRADRVGAYGSIAGATPAIDTFAKEEAASSAADPEVARRLASLGWRAPRQNLSLRA